MNSSHKVNVKRIAVKADRTNSLTRARVSKRMLVLNQRLPVCVWSSEPPSTLQPAYAVGPVNLVTWSPW